MESLQGSGQQITLFYSGSVNVFDHVPPHKVQTIMLLLSDHCSSMNTAGMGDCGKDLSIRGCAKASSPPVGPPMPTTDNAPITQSTKKQHPIISKRSHAELPFARKASLARFLEKRKDRVQGAMKVSEVVGATCAAEENVEAFGGPCSKRMKH